MFFWKSAPACRLVGMGRLKRPSPKDASGNAYFTLMYLTAPLERPLGIEDLRSDRVVGDASFLKSGAAGTVFPLSERQGERLLQLICMRNPALAGFAWQRPPDARAVNDRALSVRQPWAELIMRGVKQIEVRSRPTHVRGRVHVYASLGTAAAPHCDRVEREYGLEIASLPKGVLVGTVEIIGCRPLTEGDSHAAAFPIASDRMDYAWLLAEPRRSSQLVKPRNQPQPIFFRPF